MNGQKLFVQLSKQETTFEDCIQGSGGPASLRPPGSGRAPPENASSCPVISPTSALDPRNNMPRSLSANEASPGQRGALGTERITSSIPMAAAVAGTSASSGQAAAKPHHQAGVESSAWVYPSEQMFYNAMKRKGWDPREEDMGTVVKIHNAVNERAWRQVVQWEKKHCGAGGCEEGPRLVKFRGRPKDYSPKALLMNFLGYKLPFDRHDWIVDRCGKEVRYVIDFYNAAPLPGMPVAMHLDVRPALDSPGAAWDRAQEFLTSVLRDLKGRWAVVGGEGGTGRGARPGPGAGAGAGGAVPAAGGAGAGAGGGTS